jgi:alcohol dehydrogenase (cytochrome c)
MTTLKKNKRRRFRLVVRSVFRASMACIARHLRNRLMTVLAGAVLYTTAYAQIQDPSAKAPPSSIAVAQPATGGPTQAEMDKADSDPNQWLTSNKGYLGYRYSKLTQINTQNVGNLKVVCSFKLGEKGSFQSGLLVYNGVLYATSAFGTFAIDAVSCQKRWTYQYKPGAKMGQQNNKGAAILNGRVVRGTPDGHLIALDAATGKLLWDRTIMDASVGEYATAVPLVWKDMIFIGKAGGELGIRRRNDGFPCR